MKFTTLKKYISWYFGVLPLLVKINVVGTEFENYDYHATGYHRGANA